MPRENTPPSEILAEIEGGVFSLGTLFDKIRSDVRSENFKSKSDLTSDSIRSYVRSEYFKVKIRSDVMYGSDLTSDLDFIDQNQI